MPEYMKLEGAKKFRSAALRWADLLGHGRDSYEGQPNSPRRTRIIVTRRIGAVAPDPSNPKATLWNPAGAGFEAACDYAGLHSGTVAVIGGPDVFGIVMDRYGTFWLSHAPHVRLPAREPCFPGVPER